MEKHDRVTLRASNGNYVELNTGTFSRRELRATACAIHGFWQTFKLIPVADGRFALQALDGKYVCAEDGGGIEAAVGGEVPANFGAGDKCIFNGNLLGLAAAVRGGTAEFHIPPESLTDVGPVKVTCLGYFTFGWQRTSGQPIGEVQCGGFTFPGGGMGEAEVTHA